ncbi:MAG TPA: CPBP family intramembrane glutamic endopeptidase [Spirochaetia bacterium]|nr:CPBP family intramembrane glutamic endopeptidase [Spirochaetia bacterium]
MEWLLSPFKPLSVLMSNPYASLFSVLCVSFLLLSSFLSMRNWKRRCADDFNGVMVYFLCFFVLLMVVPLVIILLNRMPLSSFGIGVGNWRLGIVLGLAGLVLTVAGLASGWRDPAMQEFYPFSKEAMKSPGRFVIYESAYVVLYYMAWELTFRGVVLFGLLALLAPSLAGMLTAILLQTIVSTVFHIGHPDSEILGAFIFGLLSGLVTAATGSFLYALVLHASAGILNDSVMYRRSARARRLAR